MKKSKSGVPFRIVAGHHGGTVSKIRKHRSNCQYPNLKKLTTF